MANQISMGKKQDILTLYRHGMSQRDIARKLSVHRQTVSRYVHLWQEESKPTISPPGSDASNDSKSTIVPAGLPGRKSTCEPFRSIITEKLQTGLSAQRIWQDIHYEHGFPGSYDSVKRFVRRLECSRPVPFRRMECGPGEEVQVDFGKGAPVVLSNGKKRRPHVFRIVLSFSRKGYSEVVWHQDTETFIRCLENAFRYFGGVPKTIVIDNLKAAVIHADWYDPQVHPKLLAFARHYGTVILPTRPYRPRHKGKIESGVKYVQNNGLAGYEFDSLAEQNRHLENWETNIADTRIHGTTRQQVGVYFEKHERPALSALPPGYFPSFREARRKVHRDGHIAVEHAFYSVPPEYLGRELWVRYDTRIVRIYNERFEQIALHAKADPGRRRTDMNHISSRKISAVERGADYLLRKIECIGEHSERWSKAMLIERGIEGIRVLQGLISLANKHRAKDLERACEIALRQGCFRLRPLRHLLKRGSQQQELPFMQDHPVIRDLAEYGQWMRSQTSRTSLLRNNSKEDVLVPPPTQAGRISIKRKSPHLRQGEYSHEKFTDRYAQNTPALRTEFDTRNQAAGSSCQQTRV